jgi:hypothetical protein
MEEVAATVCAAMRAPLANMAPQVREMMLEMTLSAMVRLCLEHQAPTEVAAKLHALAEAIESG